MKVLVRHITVVILACVLLSCHSTERQVRQLERSVQDRMAYAEKLVVDIGRALDQSAHDTILMYAKASDGVLVQIYDGPRLLYWSCSWLSIGNDRYGYMDTWSFRHWRNADGLLYHTRHGRYNIELRIPIKFHYAEANKELPNRFIEPYRGKESWTLNHHYDANDYAIRDKSGHYLFSVCVKESDNGQQVSDKTLAETFSFQCIEQEKKALSRQPAFWTVLVSSIVMALIGLIVLGYAIWVLIRHRGWLRVPVAKKVQMVIEVLVMLCCMVTYILSVTYSRSQFRDTMRYTLVDRARYVQESLKSAHYWDIDLKHIGPEYMDAELRHLSAAYDCDIMVYDNNGILAGSSTPALFESGLLSRRIHPEVMFCKDHAMILDERLGDMHYVTAYTDMYNGSSLRIGYIALPTYASRVQENAYINQFVSRLMPAYLIIIFITLLLGRLFARYITRAIELVNEQIRHYQVGVTNPPIQYPYQDEIGMLVDRYNEMLRRMEDSSRKLAAAERESAWRTMARQVAHEINNTLTPMKLTLQQMQRLWGSERFDDYFRSSSAILVTEIDNLSHIATSFSSFAKMPEVKPSPVDIASIISTTIALCRANTDAIPIIYRGADSGLMAVADGAQIGQVFINIIKNAIQVLQHKSDGMITVQLTDWAGLMQPFAPKEGDWVEIYISDNGPGIAKEIRERIFTPNFTTKTTGAGLGLAYAKNVVEGSGGKISFVTDDRGTTFYIYLKKE